MKAAVLLCVVLALVAGASALSLKKRTREHVGVDPCASNPCVHGSCSGGEGAPSFYCMCNAGFAGSRCEKKVMVPKTPCNPSPCKNGGICSAVGDWVTCSCQMDFVGSRCEQKVMKPETPCPASIKCKNGGRCVHVKENGKKTPKCQCSPQWTGARCDKPNIDPTFACASNPCKNGAQCSGGKDSWYCSCPQGWSGATCATKAPGPTPTPSPSSDPCSSNPCKHGAQCSGGKESWYCACPQGWTGATCAKKAPAPTPTPTPSPSFEPCSSNPCQNGGICTGGTVSWYCACQGPWTGVTCSTPSSFVEVDNDVEDEDEEEEEEEDEFEEEAEEEEADV